MHAKSIYVFIYFEEETHRFGDGEFWKSKSDISRKERLQQLLTKHDTGVRAEYSFTYADILQRIFQRSAEL